MNKQRIKIAKLVVPPGTKKIKVTVSVLMTMTVTVMVTVKLTVKITILMMNPTMKKLIK